MKGQMMHYPLTTNVILEYGNRVFHHKKIITYLPDKTRHEYTFADMYKRTKRLSNALINKLGVKKGENVGTFAWNNYQHLELYYGIPGAGAVCHTINIRLSLPQIEFIINNSENRVIFIDATLVPLIEKIANSIPSVEHFVLLNAPADFSTSLQNTMHYEDLIDDVSEDFSWVDVDENDACGMCYTSGTTGDPKGALYSHRSTYLHASTILMPNAGNYCSNDRVLLIVPQFHVMAWGFPYMCVMAGTDMVLPTSNLQPDAIIDIVQKEQINKANGVPSIWLGVYQTMKKNPPKEKFPLEEYLVGGSALTASLIKAFEDDFGVRGVHAWGMTETSPLGTISRLQRKHQPLSDEEQLTIRAKQGIELSGVEIRIMKDDGTEAPRDGKTFGELQIKGAWIIESYYKNASRESFTEDGWFRTGDVSTITEDGYMEITDRTKDLIKSGGEWISSVALEGALMAHPKIKEAAVIAIPDEKWVERPLAGIVLSDEQETVNESELQDFLSKDFAKYQIPDEFRFLKEVPKTSVGKFNKKEMRRLYAEGKL